MVLIIQHSVNKFLSYESSFYHFLIVFLLRNYFWWSIILSVYLGLAF